MVVILSWATIIRMNIVIISRLFSEIKVSLSPLDQYLWRLWTTLWKDLGALIELIGYRTIGTVPWCFV